MVVLGPGAAIFSNFVCIGLPNRVNIAVAIHAKLLINPTDSKRAKRIWFFG
jgi:hypothetical protein